MLHMITIQTKNFLNLNKLMRVYMGGALKLHPTPSWRPTLPRPNVAPHLHLLSNILQFPSLCCALNFCYQGLPRCIFIIFIGKKYYEKLGPT